MNGLRKKTIIGFDMDGVIIDLAPQKMRLARERGFIISLRDTQSDLLKKALPENIRKEIQKKLYGEREYTLSAAIMPEVAETLEKLTKMEIAFFLISRRRSYDPAIKLLMSKGIWPQYFDRNNAFFVESSQDKNTVAKKLGITHFLDDELDVLEILDSVPNKILFDPVDAFPEWSLGTRITHWNELLPHIG